MNDFFDSLKDIKKEMVKNHTIKTQNLQKNDKKQEKTTFSKEDVVAYKEQKLQDEFLAYIKNSDIRKI